MSSVNQKQSTIISPPESARASYLSQYSDESSSALNEIAPEQYTVVNEEYKKTFEEYNGDGFDHENLYRRDMMKHIYEQDVNATSRLSIGGCESGAEGAEYHPEADGYQYAQPMYAAPMPVRKKKKSNSGGKIAFAVVVVIVLIVAGVLIAAQNSGDDSYAGQAANYMGYSDNSANWNESGPTCNAGEDPNAGFMAPREENNHTGTIAAAITALGCMVCIFFGCCYESEADKEREKNEGPCSLRKINRWLCTCWFWLCMCR